ncbi:uncharacterized protein MYCGRDRAFT_106276 [Zymoseptoria tritici IPO323]|uniref:Uncharacterized protein n=1 Tax=Zymoseptoria tritici (strain CBS 115943 / IPO323) TaxID=336722 RepID=F9XPI6_ZYMTI|nr:uncharacterized protein MYCGRDRAFT_106276 [Zymoseptoria tritici IPO323]EGP83193.1 hypothetical protein MYCGRDRAFT_106276 [Zymoseptoria tritici IPO323]
MDHLCPRQSFPLAPCLSCLSKTPVSSPRSRDMTDYFPSPPTRSTLPPTPSSQPNTRLDTTTKQRTAWPKSKAPRYTNTTPTSSRTRVSARERSAFLAFRFPRLSQSSTPRRDSQTLPWMMPTPLASD